MKIMLQDYERIYKTINTIVLNENADPTGACTFFGFIGSHILSNHYEVDAQPVAGLCMYHLGGDNNVLTFGELRHGNLVSSMEAFHCWVLVDDWLIDFMAPTFPQLLRNSGRHIGCLPKMMQKPLSSMAQSAGDLQFKGDFYYQINPEITKNRQEYFSSRQAYSDLAEICNRWYQKPPRRMQEQIHIGDGKGVVNSLSLAGESVDGAW